MGGSSSKGKKDGPDSLAALESGVPHNARTSRRSSMLATEEVDLAVTYSPEALRELWRDFLPAKKQTTNPCPPDLPFKEFQRFLRKYYGGLDEGLLGRILTAFDDEESNRVSFHEFASTLSVLEGDSPTEKLKSVFRIYDDDCDGYIGESEINEVLDQMVSAALYLGYDSAELREFFEKILKDIDANHDGKISLEEWVQGGINSVALLKLLGLDTSEFNPHAIREGDHEWRLKHFRHGYVCNACHKPITGKTTLICNVCRAVCHQKCGDSVTGCRGTYVDQLVDGMKPEHHWVDGNVQDKCVHCKKVVKSKASVKGSTCSWCKSVVHLGCRSAFSLVCDLGEYRNLILPAMSFTMDPASSEPEQPPPQPSDGAQNDPHMLTSRDRVGTITRLPQLPLHIIPNPDHSGAAPFLVFVNSRSGANQGLTIMRACRYLLNPRQVFDLNEVGPEPGLRLFATAHNAKVICCGGDGTVGWVISALDKLVEEGLYKRKKLPAIGTIPLGTGNDLARCLNWGGGFTGEPVGKLLLQLHDASLVYLDRWRLKIEPNVPKGEDDDDIPLTIVNNYFSIGVDASIALRFHHERENHPNRFKSRMKNKFFYAQYGAEEALHRTCADLQDDIEIIVDGIPVKLPTLAGIAVLNIPSMYGGSNLWGVQKSKRFADQHIGDQLIEVVGIYGALHAAQVKGGLRQSAKRIAQGRHIVIKTRKLLPMQTDGEPWMQNACTVTIAHHNQVPMLRKAGRTSQSLFAPSSGVERASIVHGKRNTPRRLGSLPTMATLDEGDEEEEEEEVGRVVGTVAASADDADPGGFGASAVGQTDPVVTLTVPRQDSATAPF
eukprot:m.7556 g.7556  ORF g.7556 m.7556 type:complete len:834 (-) comp2974_c0_seq1:448-2949(-)